MNYTEQAEAFSSAGATLIGVLTLPAVPAQTAVVIVVGGPQYRAGSHRQFVLLARALADAGHAVLRFDCQGMGDSGGEPRGFEQMTGDIAAAIERVCVRTGSVERVVLWGLCDGASAALLYCQETADPRVRGLCLLNPWVRTDLSLARTQVKHYYSQRLTQPAFWAKLLRGDVARDSVTGLLRGLRTALGPTEARIDDPTAYTARMAQAWQAFDGPRLLMLSGRDYTAKEFTEHVAADPAWADAFQHPRLEQHSLPDADHTLSASGDHARAERLTIEWLERTSYA